MSGFPKPRPREPYRSSGDRPVIPETPPAPRKKLAAPEPPTRPPAAPVPSLAEIRREERVFWRRNSLLAQYPRPFALAVTILGALATWAIIDVLAHGGAYGMLRTLFSPAIFFAGLWPLLWGAPEEEDGTAPGWWTVGYVGSVACGLCVGIWLLWRLMQATTM
jgi:hypothetical protein